MLPLSDFELGICKIPQWQRSKNLTDFFQAYGAFLSILNVRVVGNELVDLDTDEGQERFKELNKKAIDDGLEGVMLKDPDAPYELKRSVAWLKLKPFIDVSLEIIGYEEGTGRNEGRLGALVCSGEEDGKIVVSNVGSGFDDSDRLNFWQSRDELIGQIVEVRADAITKSQDSETYSLRFPRFLRFRGFQPGEKM
jgi:DNA ligase-1